MQNIDLSVKEIIEKNPAIFSKKAKAFFHDYDYVIYKNTFIVYCIIENRDTRLVYRIRKNGILTPAYSI